MGIFGKKKVQFKASTLVGITQNGKVEAQNYTSRGTQFLILSKLSERSPMTVADLADETDLDIGELKHWLGKMFPAYIRAMEEGS